MFDDFLSKTTETNLIEICMRMRSFRLLRSILSLVVCILGLMSCSEKDDGIPSNQIHYTTKNNSVLELENLNSFGGAKIISNTYSPEDSVYIIEFSTEITEIGENSFYDCKSLTSVIIPPSVKKIGKSAFEDCKNLTSVNIPPLVTEIGIRAFRGCSSLTSISIPASVKKIEKIVFLGCKSLTNIKVDSDNPVYDSREDCNAIIHTKSNTLITGCQNTIIPKSVIKIDNFAFGLCSSLTSISIPKSVKEIGIFAFSNCSSLKSISIPPSVIVIGDCAFADCSSLTAVKVSKNTEIADDAFEDCPNVKIERF